MDLGGRIDNEVSSGYWIKLNIYVGLKKRVVIDVDFMEVVYVRVYKW